MTGGGGRVNRGETSCPGPSAMGRWGELSAVRPCSIRRGTTAQLSLEPGPQESFPHSVCISLTLPPCILSQSLCLGVSVSSSLSVSVPLSLPHPSALATVCCVLGNPHPAGLPVRTAVALGGGVGSRAKEAAGIPRAAACLLRGLGQVPSALCSGSSSPIRWGDAVPAWGSDAGGEKRGPAGRVWSAGCCWLASR